MTNQEIVELIAKEKTVEEIVNRVGRGENKTDLQDLTQDIYIELLQKNNTQLNNLYQTNQIKFYISRVVVNNIKSKNSRYYYIYKKNKQKLVSGTLGTLAELLADNETKHE